MAQVPLRILFTGYAPVHFVSFMPLYHRLVNEPGVEVHVAGGLREKRDDGYVFHTTAMYRPFGISPERMLSMDQIAERDFDLLFGANTKMLTPRSVNKKIQIFHGVSFRNRAVRKENLAADFFFLSGPYMKRRFVDGGLLDENDTRGLDMGFLKTDRLVDGSLDRHALLASYGFDGSRPVVLYAPTGQKHCSMETMGMDFIRAIQESGKYDLLVKLHDHPHGCTENWAARVAEVENAHTRLVESFDVTPLLYMSDVLVSDASSVSSEFSLLDRPMVFLDVPKLLAKAAKKDGSMMDMDTWGRNGGIIAPDPDAAMLAIEESLAHPAHKSEIRRAMAQDLFFNPGHSVEKAVDWIKTNFLTSMSIAS
jgi:CDP-glycerol:poly(glycerophosphate) glycerophosphotransferase